MLQFLMGLQTPGVIAALTQYGFTEADLRKGVELLAAVARTRLKPVPEQDAGLVEKLDAFENRWFPIVRATLEHNYPSIGVAFFANLVQTSGIECAVSVGTFVERLDGLDAGDYGKDGPAARALLAQRGLTPERVAEAKLLVSTISSFVQSDGPQVTAAERDAVEEALWAWYREWSVIARAAINDRRTLRALGFRQEKPGEAKSDDDAQDPATQAPALPASTPTLALTNGAASRDA